VHLTILPTLNACLNGLAAVALVTGFVFIRRGQWRRHRAAMVTALVLSGLFLASYLVYHYQVGSVRFQGEGTIRSVYLAILLTHTVLAVTVPFFAGFLVYFATKRRFDQHRAVARWGLPIWIYVSVTGVVIYLMLYHLPIR